MECVYPDLNLSIGLAVWVEVGPPVGPTYILQSKGIAEGRVEGGGLHRGGIHSTYTYMRYLKNKKYRGRKKIDVVVDSSYN